MKQSNPIKTFFVIAAIMLVAAFINACATTQQQTPVETQAPITGVIEPGSWETNHPERAPWSDKLVTSLIADMSVFASAEDVTALCPKFKSLTVPQKATALREFWIAIAYHESSYNPKSYAVDVGEPDDKGSWSVGLFQMSANDGAAKKFGYGFTDLQDPLKNIDVALEQMKRQITKTGLYFLPNANPNRYWATILVGNKYNQIADIKARVLKYAPACK